MAENSRVRNVYSLDGEKKSEVELPEVFDIPFRPDLIKRDFLASFTKKIQPNGVDPDAGTRTTAESIGSGSGRARVRRKRTGDRNAAFVPFAVGGRTAHPPKAEENPVENINKKERELARKSAISSTQYEKYVEERGHQFDNSLELPIILSDEIQKVNKTAEVREIFKSLGNPKSLGIWEDVLRAKEKQKKTRSGKGKSRGRKYKGAKSVLIVVEEDEGIVYGARNLPGVEIIEVKNLGTIHLSPGAKAGRLTIWSESAIKALEEM